MSISALIGAGQAGFFTFGPGTFCGVGNADSFYYPTSVNQTQVVFGAATSLSNMRVTVSNNNFNRSWAIFINGLAGSEAVSISSSNHTGTDATHTDTINQGDKVATNMPAAGGFAGVKYAGYTGSTFGAPVANNHTNSGSGVSITRGVTRYYDITGGSGVDNEFTTDGALNFRFKACTLSYFSGYLDSNTFNATETLTLRKNSSTTLNGTISFASSTAGVATDTTHSDSLSDNDLVYAIGTNAANAGAAVLYTLSAWRAFVNFETLHCTGALSGGHAFSTGGNAATCYANPIGGFADAATSGAADDGNLQNATIDFSAAWTNLRFGNITTTPTAATTVTSWLNVALGNMTLSIANGFSGNIEDTTHQDSVGQGNTLAIQITTPSGGTLVWSTHTSELGPLFQFSAPSFAITGAALAVAPGLSLTGGTFTAANSGGIGAAHLGLTGGTFSFFLNVGAFSSFSIMRNTHADSAAGMRNTPVSAVGPMP